MKIYQTAGDDAQLFAEKHIQFIRKGLVDEGLPEPYVSLDASRPWLIYWSLHALDLLDVQQLDDAELCFRAAQTILACQSPSFGGFGGGVHKEFPQISHLAPTYASLLSLAVLGSSNAWAQVDCINLKSWLMRLKCLDGPFRMHEPDGEVDVRAVYCAIVAGKLTDTWDDELERGVLNWLAQCQTWEGGFGGSPGAEAHGGYTFCALAAAVLLNNHNLTRDSFNIPRLIAWLTSQQVADVGGFRGRTHKLVDSCYSFWQGACFRLLHSLDPATNATALLNTSALQKYILTACQCTATGGLRDKPGKHPDFYHTCYALSGLTITLPDQPIDARFNLRAGKAERMIAFFEK